MVKAKKVHSFVCVSVSKGRKGALAFADILSYHANFIVSGATNLYAGAYPFIRSPLNIDDSIAARDISRPDALAMARHVHYLPFLKNRRFVGRHDELHELQQKLLIKKDCQQIAVVGLGGVGKTQIALEFAQLVKREWTEYWIFWVPAVSLETFEQACAEIARILQLPQAADDKQDVKELVKQHLSGQSARKWLLIVDNADDRDVMFGTASSGGVADFLPKNDDGVTVFTSRRWEMAESLVGNDLLEVGKMSEEEAVLFMRASLV
jgi:hypothetical protein